MQRPIGVTLLAIGAGTGRRSSRSGAPWSSLASPTSRSSARKSRSTIAQWGQAFWALLLAAIWFWVAEGFWNVRAYAWSFGIFISLFTLIFGFFAAPRWVRRWRPRSVGWLLADRDLLLPELPGRPRRSSWRAGDVAPDPRAASRHGADAGRRRRQMAAATPGAAQPRHAASGAPTTASAPDRSTAGSAGQLVRRSDEPDPRRGSGSLLVARSGDDRGDRSSRAASSGQSVGGVEPGDVRLRAEPGPLALGERDVAPGVELDRGVAVSSPSRTAHASR